MGVTMFIMRIDHIQLAMPAGGEGAARAFYAGLLDLVEVPKPTGLAQHGGAWFETGEVRLHLGVDHDFRPARKAHPGLLVHGLADLVSRLRDAGVPVMEDALLPGYDRVFVEDPFGNRIELMERKR
jgi:catechol 2,3-dioxygenase-like lactoylglutathione lyase family enzyme